MFDIIYYASFYEYNKNHIVTKKTLAELVCKTPISLMLTKFTTKTVTTNTRFMSVKCTSY